MRIPPAFAAHAPSLGPGAAEWLAGLPRISRKYAREWNLTFDGEPMTGFVSLVLPVRRADGTPAVLKLGWPHEESADEPLALSIGD